MYHSTQWRVLFLCCVLSFTACNPIKPNKPFVHEKGSEEPLPFEEAVQFMLNQLLRHTENYNFKQKKIGSEKSRILFNPFLFIKNPDKVLTSIKKGKRIPAPHSEVKQQLVPDGNELYEILDSELKTSRACGSEVCAKVECTSIEFIQYPPQNMQSAASCQKRWLTQFSLHRISATQVGESDYILHGLINLVPIDSMYSSRNELYVLYMSIVDSKTNTVVATTNRFIVDELYLSDQDINGYPHFRLPLEYSGLGYLLANPQQPNRDFTAPDFSAMVQNVLHQADSAYNNQNFKAAYGFYKEVVSLDTTPLPAVYEKLYRTAVILKEEGAEKYLDDWIGAQLQIDFEMTLPLTFIFEVGSTHFSLTEDVYVQWVEHLNPILEKNKYCLSVVGHSSKSGTTSYNRCLSLQRAHAVMNLLDYDYPYLSLITPIGKASENCIQCTGSDNAFDAIDRRVELNFRPRDTCAVEARGEGSNP